MPKRSNKAKNETEDTLIVASLNERVNQLENILKKLT